MAEGAGVTGFGGMDACGAPADRPWKAVALIFDWLWFNMDRNRAGRS